MGTMENITRGLQAILSHPTTFSSLLAFAIAGPASLASWLAVQHATTLPVPQSNKPVDEDKQRRRRRWRTIASITFGLALIAVELSIFWLGSAQVVNTFLTALVAIALHSSLLSLLATVFAPAKFAVHRAVSPVDDPKVISKLKLVRGSVSPLRATFCILLAIGLNLHDYFTPWHSLLAGAAVTLRMAMQLVAPISTRRATVVSLRGVIIVLLAWIALSAILSAVFIAMALAWS